MTTETALVPVAEKARTTGQQRVKALENRLAELAPQILKTLPNGMSYDRFQAVTVTALAKNPDLGDCEPSSVIMAVLDAAAVGLEPTGSLGRAYLIPYKGKNDTRAKAQLQIGYNGYRDLAMRSGQVSSIEARVVYEGDTFEVSYGTKQTIVHVPTFETSDPGKITHAYCVTHMKDGAVMFDVMTRKEIDGIRSRSRSANKGPWVSDYAEMAKKTAIRRHVKALPLTIEAIRVIERDDEGEFSTTVEPTPTKASAIRAQLAERLQPAVDAPGQPQEPEVGSDPVPGVSADQPTDLAGVVDAGDPPEDAVVVEIPLGVCGVLDEGLGCGPCVLDLGHKGKPHMDASESRWPNR